LRPEWQTRTWGLQLPKREKAVIPCKDNNNNNIIIIIIIIIIITSNNNIVVFVVVVVVVIIVIIELPCGLGGRRELCVCVCVCVYSIDGSSWRKF